VLQEKCAKKVESLSPVVLHGPQQQQRVKRPQLCLQTRPQPRLQQQAAEEARRQAVGLVIGTGAVAQQRQAQRLAQLLCKLRSDVDPRL